MAFFPLYIDLEGKNVLAVGAGTVGSRRIETLVRFGARVTVVSLTVTEQVRNLANEGRVTWICADYLRYRAGLNTETADGADLCRAFYFLVLAATGDGAVDELAAEDGRQMKAFVNVAGCKESSDFYFPAIAGQGDITAGIIANGRNHGLAKRAAKEVDGFLRDIFKNTDNQE